MEKFKNPLVSVIMGIYNCESTLAESIESILNQTYTNWELIMCDDGSKDQTLEIAKSYEVQYPHKIKVIQNEKNMGLAYSLNHCLQNSLGEYIARMDSDDISLPERFERQVAFLNQNSEYAVVGSAIILYDGEKDLNTRIFKEKPDKLDILHSVPHVHPTIMMRKKAYDRLQGYTVSVLTKRCEDLDMWFRFYKEGYLGYNLQEPLLKYHESIHDYKKRNLKNAIQASKVIYKGYKLLDFSFSKYIYIFRPIIAASIPHQAMYLYHKKIKG